MKKNIYKYFNTLTFLFQFKNMDLKLKDEITKLLVEEPGLSISELSKKTNNYYSYTHKVVSEMEERGELIIKHKEEGNKKITVCELNPDYKHDWISKVKRFIKSVSSDAEVKAAITLMYSFLLYIYVQGYSQRSQEFVGVNSIPSQPLINTDLVLKVLLIIVPALILLNYLRRDE